MMTMLAADNHLQVDMAVGTLLRSQPVVIEGDADILATEFTLTGGLGYTPVTIKGLARPDGWRLEKATATGWERVDQSVEGNDYWQAYDDPAASGFDLIFNVYNRGTHTYRLVR